MEKTNLENLNRLAKLFGTDRLISPEDIQEIRSILIGVLANNKKEVESLTDETKQAVNSILDKVLTEHDAYLEKTKQMAQEAKSDVAETIKTAKEDFAEVKRLAKEIMDSKPKDGEDADEEYVIGEVLNRIKLPEYKEIVLDDGGAIVDKINSLPVNEENQIDAKHIKNLPVGKNGAVISGGVTRKIVQQMIDAGGGGASPLTTKGDLYTYSTVDARLGVGTNGQVLTADSAETTGLKWATVSGTGDVVGPASATDNAIARYDGTTGKLIQNSAATIADTSGNITAGTYNGNTIGAGSSSGTNTGDQTTISGNAGTATALQTARTIGTITGDATSAGSSFDGSANNTNALTLATVNSNVGSFGSATAAPAITVNAKGLVTAVTTNTITPAVGSITGLGTGVGTALAVNVGSAGAFLPNNAAGTSLTGIPYSLTGTANQVTLSAATGNVTFSLPNDLRLTSASVGTNADSVPTLSSTSTLTNKTLTSPTLTTPSAFTTGGTITLAENTSIALDPAGSADGKYTGITVTGTAGYTQAFGDLVYLAVADSRWELAVADASATAGPVMLAMVVVAGTDGNACTLLLQGIIRADAKFPTMTVGATQFVGETAGAIQGSIPTGADNVIRTVGYALTADELYFNPSTDWQISVA